MKRVLLLVSCVLILTAVGASFRRPQIRIQSVTDVATEKVLPSDVEQVIAAWQAAEVLPLASAKGDLQQAVDGFQNAGLNTVSTSFPPTKDVALTAEQSSDLANAIVEFLAAYHSNDPAKIFSYMKARGQRLDDERRKALTRGVAKKSTRDLSQLSDSEFYIEAWNQYKMNSHWHGLVAKECTWQSWDGSGLAVDEVRQIETDPLSNPLSTAAVLSKLFQGNLISQSSFVPARGSLEDELTKSEPVILADVTLVIQLDQSLNHERVAYVVRLWFNHAANRWQPIAFVGIPWSPTINAMPMILH